jgi:hypothetical protein
MKTGGRWQGQAPAGYHRLSDNGPTTVAFNKAGDEPAGYIGV